MQQAWFLFAITGVVVGAVVHIIDMYLREDRVFALPVEPAIISGVLQSMLWVVIPFVGFEHPASMWMALLAIGGGILHIASLFFYFKAIFAFGDVSVISMLWNLLVAMVPILAFVLLGERLTSMEYLGIVALFAGALILSSSRGVEASLLPAVSKHMLVAVFLMGLSMVCLKGVYERETYWSAYVFYNFGIVGGGVLGYGFLLPGASRARFRATFRSFLFFFIGIEFLQLLGEFFSNLATSLGPVSLVAAIESLQPLFVILISVVVFLGGRVFFRTRTALLRAVCSVQFQQIPMKTLALACMLLGVFLIR